MKNEILVGHTLYLRAVEISDIVETDWHQWYNNYDLTASNQHGVYPINLDQEKEYFLNQDKSKKITFAVCSLKNDKVIGNVSLINIDLLNRKAELACTIGINDSLTSGLESIGLIITHGFNRLNLNKISGGAHSDLHLWVKMLNVFGFKEEGISREDSLRNGKYSDTIKFSLLLKEYNKILNLRDNNYLMSSSTELYKHSLSYIK